MTHEYTTQEYQKLKELLAKMNENNWKLEIDYEGITKTYYVPLNIDEIIYNQYHKYQILDRETLPASKMYFLIDNNKKVIHETDTEEAMTKYLIRHHQKLSKKMKK